MRYVDFILFCIFDGYFIFFAVDLIVATVVEVYTHYLGRFYSDHLTMGRYVYITLA